MHANIEFSSHSNHHHFFFLHPSVVVISYACRCSAFIVTHNKEWNFFSWCRWCFIIYNELMGGKEVNEMEWKVYVWMDVREAQNPSQISLRHLSKSPFLRIFIFLHPFQKEIPFVYFFFFLYCYVADYAAAAASAYIDGNHTWKLSPMNWLLCVYLNVNLFICLFVLIEKRGGKLGFKWI